MTTNPWSYDGGATVAYSMLGGAARQAGPSAGVTQGGVATGLFGAWQLPEASYPGMVDGLLVGLLKIQSSTINQYVKLDGSLNMLGDLNMGNYRVNNVKDIQLLGQADLPRQSGAVAPMVSTLLPNYVLMGVFNVGDYDSDPVSGSVPLPVCPDQSDSSNGVPRILVKMASMYNEMYGAMGGGSPVSPTDTQAQMIAKTTAAYGGWNFYALQDTGANAWRVYIRRFYDNGYIPGEGLAEVYCVYQ